MKYKNVVIIFIFILLISILSACTGNGDIGGNTTTLNTSYPSKIGYVYGWENKQYLLDQDQVMRALPKGLILEVSNRIMDDSLNILPDTNINLHNKFKPYVNYYHINKIAFIEIDGIWVPYGIVGSRQAALSRVEIYDDAGQLITYPSNEILSIIDIKPKFNDDNWIINKAIENYENNEGIYSDIYASVFRFSYELPTIK